MLLDLLSPPDLSVCFSNSYYPRLRSQSSHVHFILPFFMSVIVIPSLFVNSQILRFFKVQVNVICFSGIYKTKFHWFGALAPIVLEWQVCSSYSPMDHMQAMGNLWLLLIFVAPGVSSIWWIQLSKCFLDLITWLIFTQLFWWQNIDWNNIDAGTYHPVLEIANHPNHLCQYITLNLSFSVISMSFMVPV